MGHIHIHALGINTGGGLVLLRQLIKSESSLIKNVVLDQRIYKEFSSLENSAFYQHGLVSEYISQVDLRKRVKKEDHVLFFSNRPPLIPFPCRVSVFHQNALLLEKLKFTDIRGRINQWWLKIFNAHADGYIVQNRSMQMSLRRTLGKPVNIKVAPFGHIAKTVSTKAKKKNSFIYVSSFLPHKNHEKLILAWEYLVGQQVAPALTLVASGQQLQKLKSRIKESTASSFIRLVTDINHEQVFEELLSHETLIFPSLSESLGLPLLEAKSCGLAIVASELDFVRDVITPDQSFDPESSVSIARAVRRHLGLGGVKEAVVSPDEFLDNLAFSSKASLQKAS